MCANATKDAGLSGGVNTDAEFVGKYEEAGKIGGWLIRQFYETVVGLLLPHVGSNSQILEIGCGAGYSTEQILCRLPSNAGYVGSDIGESLLRKAAQRNPDVPFLRQSAYQIAMPSKSVDVVVMLEVLEHLDDPMLALSEIRRVARTAAIISTPREPLWCALNLARGKYLRSLGNTPGHIQHWSSKGLRKEVSRYFEVTGMAQPVPWTVLALRPLP